jgi:hypothetical protein
MVFAHRPPGVLRFAAYSAAAVDLALGAALVVMGTQAPGAQGLQIGGFILMASCWLPPWILLAVRYELEAGHLVVRRGPIAKRIPFDALEEVRKSAPLPGLEGVIVRYRRRALRTSDALYPEDPDAFLRYLKSSAPQLESVAEGVLRRRAAP